MQNGTNPAAALSYKTESDGMSRLDDDAVMVLSVCQGDPSLRDAGEQAPEKATQHRVSRYERL